MFLWLLESHLNCVELLKEGVRDWSLKSTFQWQTFKCVLLSQRQPLFCMRYSQYSMPRMTSLKYNLACSSDRGLSVGTSITGLEIDAGWSVRQKRTQTERKREREREADKSTHQLLYRSFYQHVDYVPNTETCVEKQSSDQTSLMVETFD